MRLKRRRKVRKIVAGTLALFACITMGMMMFFSQSNMVYASENSSIDPSTAMDYQDTYNQKSTQYAGRIWTDKSVGTTAKYGNKDFNLESGEDFLVTFSALSSTQTIKSETASPIDVVFVLDFSASMTWGVDSREMSKEDGSDSRIKYLVDSLNNTIDTLVKANENNRIGIVTFNRVGRVFMELTSAKQIANQNIEGNEYLKLSTFERKYDDGKPTSDGLATIKNQINGAEQQTDSKTNIQYGLNEAMQMLMDVNDTTVDIAGTTVQRIPNVVLMSDGAPTTIFSDQGEKDWWADLSNDKGESIGWGDNDQAWSANGILPMMTASYMKNVVTEHYFKTNPNNEQMNIYTIGFSTDQQTEEMVELANLVLNPVDNLDQANNSNVNEIKLLAEAWNDYSADSEPNVHYVTNSNRQTHNYKLTHPNSNDITTLKYNTAYYPATNSEQLEEAFKNITNSMVDQGKAPTEVTGSLTSSGYITYTDILGDYMELKDVKGLVIGDTFFKGSYDKKTNSVTLNGKFENNVYGEQDLKNLQITISKDENGRQVLTMKIPASLIPIVHDIVELDASGAVKNQTEETMYPMRLVYSVGLQEGIIDKNGNVDYTELSEDYINKHLDSKGNIVFYSNYYDGTNSSLTEKTAGNTFVEYEPAHDNSYYFIQEDTGIYLDKEGKEQATTFNSTSTYYVPFTYYENGKKKTTYEERPGTVMNGYTITKDNYVYLKAGAPRLGNIATFTKDKNGSTTNTAKTYFAPRFIYRTTGDPQSGMFHVYLGNNGEIRVPSASLIISKEVTTEDGVQAPDKNETFTFKVTSSSKTNTEVLAKITTKGTTDPESQTIAFDDSGVATIQLKANQSIELLGMGNADYKIEEINNPTGFTLTDVNGADTIDENNVASGTVSMNTAETVTFTNSYNPTSVVIGDDTNAGIQVQKTLSGREWTNDDAFTFTLTPVDNAPMPEGENNNILTLTKPESGNVQTGSFGAITYDKEGTYEYTIQEKLPDGVSSEDPSLNGIAYDVHESKVTVNVTNENGQLKATVTYDDGTIASFTNTYSSTSFTGVPTSFNFTKELVGRDWTENDVFSFTLTGLEGAPMPEGSNEQTNTKTIDVTKDNAESFNFGKITYDTKGEYKYTVSEVIPENTNGITYDDHMAEITVVVTDNGDGTLSAVAQTQQNMKFTNVYTTNEVDYNALGSLQIQKNMIGKSIDQDEFKFTITAEDKESIEKAGQKVTEVTVPAQDQINSDGSYTSMVSVFDSMKFDQKDIGKTFTYTVKEVTDDTNKGYTYDQSEHTVKISVSDNGNGSLKVQTTVDEQVFDQNAVVVFNNRYDAQGVLGGQGAVKINATKTLNGRDMQASEFDFVITNTKDASKTPVSTGTNQAALDGQAASIEFTPITYTSKQLNLDVANGLAVKNQNTYTYNYTVEEKTPVSGVQALQSSFAIEVQVTDQGDGTLAVQVIYPEGMSSLNFVNVYGQEAQASIEMKGTKVLNANSGANLPDITGKYQFTISGSEGAPMPSTTTVTNDASGNIDFGLIEYTMENVFGKDVENTKDTQTLESSTRSKTFTYTITESGTVPGVINDTTSKTVTVTVTDNGDGTLSVSSLPAQGPKFTFVNTYQTTTVTSSPTDGSISIQKELEGRKLNEGEFTFQMKDTAGNVVSEASNDANGNVMFAGITFDTAGTYQYSISEVNTGVMGMNYDTSVYNAVATVTDQGDGTLKVEWSVTKDQKEIDSIVFKNTYSPISSANVQIGAIKKLEGKELSNGQFTFELKDEEGKVVSKATNDEKGMINFDPIDFDKAGKYSYTLSEVNDGQENIQYDESIYDIVIHVEDDQQGHLMVTKCDITRDGEAQEAIVFTNVYQETKQPGEGQPSENNGGSNTSAKTGAGLFISLIGSAISLMGLLLVWRKRA